MPDKVFIGSASHYVQLCHQDMLLLDQARSARKQRFDKEGLVCYDDIIAPRGGNIDAQLVAFFVNQFVDLRNHNTVVECSGLNQRRSIFDALAV